MVAATALFLLPLSSAAGPIEEVPHGDKAVHFLVLAGLALLGRRAFVEGGRAPLRLFLGLVAYAAAIEAVQAALPWRSADALDLAAGAIGAAIGLLAPVARSRPRG